ncbi:MAG: hypothetical protein K9M80_08880 [Candidatus Marinimicrobia bacterium]|nr:hypothetical protein [Candidatus Neomarinimicrobiota bacterium]
MFEKDKYRRFKLKDKKNEKEENDDRIHFRKIRHKRPTKNIWVLLAILILVFMLIILLSKMA